MMSAPLRTLVFEDSLVPPREVPKRPRSIGQFARRGTLASPRMLRTAILATWQRFDVTMARPTLEALRTPGRSGGGRRLAVPRTLVLSVLAERAPRERP